MPVRTTGAYLIPILRSTVVSVPCFIADVANREETEPINTWLLPERACNRYCRDSLNSNLATGAVI